MNDTINANMTHFYKKWITRNKTDDYYSCETYFKKYGRGTFQFESCKFYIDYKKWENSDEYITDFNTIKKLYITDCIDGFYSVCEEIIGCCDDDDDDRQIFINYLDEYTHLSTQTEKLNYLYLLYDKQYYYPNFNYSWLFDTFDNRIISDI